MYPHRRLKRLFLHAAFAAARNLRSHEQLRFKKSKRDAIDSCHLPELLPRRLSVCPRRVQYPKRRAEYLRVQTMSAKRKVTNDHAEQSRVASFHTTGGDSTEKMSVRSHMRESSDEYLQLPFNTDFRKETMNRS